MWPSLARSRLARCLALAVALLLAAAIRLYCWSDVFRADGVRLLPDGDPTYHLIRAEAIAASWPRAPWADSWLDWPNGARILWPPLFDELIATPVVLARGRAPRP